MRHGKFTIASNLTFCVKLLAIVNLLPLVSIKLLATVNSPFTVVNIKLPAIVNLLLVV